MRVAKTKALISFAVTAKLICVFVFREADLRLCFRICKKPVFSQRGSGTLLARVKIIYTS